MSKEKKSVNSITHKEERRKNIPTAEFENFMSDEDKKPIELKYSRNTDLDPQIVWRGKDDQDWSDLVVTAPPLYIQEKINPKHIIDDLMIHSKKLANDKVQEETPDMFANMFDEELDPKAKTEFYSHDQNWTNRMILGDSLQAMASLAEREGLRNKVQTIYIDPPYGINFSSNFQPNINQNTTGSDNAAKMTREPEMIKAFRDTWKDSIHSYLTYLRDRILVSHSLLNETGSIFFQIGDENSHRIRCLLDEIFGPENFVSQISFRTKIPLNAKYLPNICDSIVWYAKDKASMKFRRLFKDREIGADTQFKNIQLFSGEERSLTKSEQEKPEDAEKLGRVFRLTDLVSSGQAESSHFEFKLYGEKCYPPGRNSWKTNPTGMERLIKANRLRKPGKVPAYQFFAKDYPVMEYTNQWSDTQGASNKIYVVQTAEKVVERCLLMTTDPGDLVVDPTCGSGTTATICEQWARRWITIDSSRISLSLAKARLSGSVYKSYILKDSKEGQEIEQKLTGRVKEISQFNNSIKSGFAYHRVPHITMGAISKNTEIDVIWENYQETLEPLRQKLNSALSQKWEEWEIPREAVASWPETAKAAHAEWWDEHTCRQKEIDDSIARNAETEYLYDRPYVDNSKVRVAGPFTVESLSPHKVIAVDDDGEFLTNAVSADSFRTSPKHRNDEIDFGQVIIEHLRTSGIQQAHKEDRIKFTSINPFPGKLISAEGKYLLSDIENAPQKRAAILIGPEYGTLGRADIVAAVREAHDLKFDVLVCCSFNYDAHSSEIDQLAGLPILKARMNPDLHMADELKNTGAGNLFVVFGEPDIEFINVENDRMQVKINGVDVFHPSKGEVVSGGPESIAAWFIDTDYNEESFFVRHAYFLGSNDPYKQLKSALKAEIDKEAWESLYRDISRPFQKPETGRIAVKVINYLGDEVMKVFNIN